MRRLLRHDCALVALPAAAAVAASACGRLHFDPLERGTDSGGDTICEVGTPFGTPVLVDGLVSAAADVTLRLQSNELSGLFWSLRTGDGEIFSADRPDRASAFTVSPLAILNAANAVDADPTVSPDGSFAMFSSTRGGGAGGFDLYESERVGGSYNAPVRITTLGTAMNEGDPSWSPAESALYFTSDASGVSRIYRASRTAPATYGTAVMVPELVSAGEEFDPTPSADGLTFYFRSTRPGATGTNGDVFVATRSSLSMPFGSAKLVPELTSPVIEGPSFLSPDLCRLYFTSDRSGAVKIYVATR